MVAISPVLFEISAFAETGDVPHVSMTRGAIDDSRSIAPASHTVEFNRISASVYGKSLSFRYIGFDMDNSMSGIGNIATQEIESDNVIGDLAAV